MTVLIYLGLFILGAVIASFAGVVAERLHTGESWMAGRSRCNSCGRPLSAPDLIPILSWLLSRGRCRTCKARIPWQYPAYEFILGSVFAFSFYHFGLTIALPLFLLAVSVLAFIVLYDLRHTVVPPPASTLLIIISLAYALSTPSSVVPTLITAAVIALLFLSLHVFSRGKAMGLGDAPVALALSLLAGPYAVAGLLFSFWIGALCGILLLSVRRGGPKMGIEVPFVPYLAVGYLLAIFVQWNPLAFF
jgi:prepilin signal peptidase PulO-like enzyme (type II secretory pathway)